MDLLHTRTAPFQTAASALGLGAGECACEPLGVSANTGHRLVFARGRGMWRGEGDVDRVGGVWG